MFDVQSVKVSIPLRKKFVVSKGETKIKTNLLTILNNRYHGEASGSIHAGPSVRDIEAGLRKGMAFLRKCRKIDVGTLETISRMRIPAPARSALMAMVVNYLSGESRRYPWEILDLGTPVGIRSSFTIGIDEPAEMIRAIQDCDYPIIKIKMGRQADVALLEVLDQIGDKVVRVDVNGAWSCEQAEEMIFHLARKGVTVIEQPTDAAHV
ncbi:MAG: enolase C-terminal domain-like protein, partial [Candidatus Zixiibacteriota bacterium]